MMMHELMGGWCGVGAAPPALLLARTSSVLIGDDSFLLSSLEEPGGWAKNMLLQCMLSLVLLPRRLVGSLFSFVAPLSS